MSNVSSFEHPDTPKNREIALWTLDDIQRLTLHDIQKLTSTNFTTLFERMEALGIMDKTVSGLTFDDLINLVLSISEREPQEWEPDLMDATIQELATEHIETIRPLLLDFNKK